MKKAVAAKVSLVAWALASAAFADGPPSGGKLLVQVDKQNGSGLSYAGGAATTVSSANGGASGKTSYSPLRLVVSAGAPKNLYYWVADVVGGANPSHKLALVSTDASGKTPSTVQYNGVPITQIDFAGVTRSDNSAGELAISFAVGASTSGPTSAPSLRAMAPTWLRSNFTASIENVTGTSTATAVSTVTVGIPRDPASGLPTGKTRMSPFHLTFDASAQKALTAWLAQGKVSVMSTGAGSPTTFAAKNIRVVYQGGGAAVERTKQATTDLFTLSFSQCGPIQVTPSSATVDVEVECGGVAMATTAGVIE